MAKSDPAVLDIDPDKLKEQALNKVNGIKYERVVEGYIKYEYSSIYGSYSSIKITTLQYNGKPLKIALPNTILKLFTYFAEDNKTLMTIYIKGGKNFYYTNKDTSQTLDKDAKFDTFFANTDDALEERTELKAILDSINLNKSLYYYGLPGSIKEKLWWEYSILFNLGKMPNTIKNGKYTSEVTDQNVTVTESKKINDTYPEVKHMPTVNPFYIKGIKLSDGRQVNLNNGFPNEPLDGLNVYYKDEKKTDPLLVELKLNFVKDGSYIPGLYYLFRTEDLTKWNIRRVENNIDKTALKEILDEISSKNKLEVSSLSQDVRTKLQDLTEDLTIDFTKATKEYGTYDSKDKKQIHYKMEKVSKYTRIAHADTFTTFTIKEIKVTSDVSVSGVTLPTSGSRLSKLRAFYNGSTIKDPLLIYILKSTGSSTWIYRYSGDKEWSSLGSGDTTPASDVDSYKITRLLSKYSVPYVKIDLSKDSTYTPDGNTHNFDVKQTQVNGSSEYYGFTHTAPGNIGFKIKEVTHNGNVLSGLSSQDTLLSISAYYSGDDPGRKENLILVELRSSGGTKYEYYYRDKKDASTWSPYPGSGGGTRLQGTLLTQKLNQLKEKQRPKKPESSPPEKGDPGVIPSDYGKTDGESSTHESTGNNSSSSESTVASPQTSSNAGKIAGGIIGGLVCIVLLALLIKKVGPSVRAHLESRNPPL